MTICAAAAVDRLPLPAGYANTPAPCQGAPLPHRQFHIKLNKQDQQCSTVHANFESRGGKEDRELKLEIRRIATSNRR